MTNSPYVFEYEFHMDSGKSYVFPITIHKRSMHLMTTPDTYPDWARLGYCRCDCCTLNESSHPHCHPALNIVSFLDTFGNLESSDLCHAICRTPVRETHVPKKILIQDGLASILFLMLVASDCPYLSLFKPLVRVHIPFVSIKEAVLRVISVFLLGKYYTSWKTGSNTIITMGEFSDLLELFRQVYVGLLSRVKNLPNKDASRNAFIVIESLNQIIGLEIEEELKSLDYLFDAWGYLQAMNKP